MSRSRRFPVAIALAAVMAVAAIGPASAATVTASWNAKVGSAGANGTARLQVFTTGTGAVALKLVKLRASTTLPIVISKGTCKSVGTTVATLSSVRSTSSGAVTRTLSLTAAQVKLVKAATKGTGKIAIRVGTGTSRRCGTFALVAPPAVVPSVAATIPVGIGPTNVAIDPTGIWVTNWYDNTLSRIDPASNVVLAVHSYGLPVTAAPEAITAAFGSLWVTVGNYDDTGLPAIPGTVIRVDPLTGAVIGAPIPVGRGPLAIAASTEAIWISNTLDGTVSRIDPLANLVTATIPVGDSPLGIAAGFGSVWVASVTSGKVTRIDPTTNQVTAIVQTQLGAIGVAIGAGSVWVTYCGCEQASGVVSRIDPATNSVVAAVPVGVEAGFVTFGGGYIWVAVDADMTVVQIDPGTNAIKKAIPVGAKSWGIAASDHAVWVVHHTASGAVWTSFLPGTITRINF